MRQLLAAVLFGSLLLAAQNDVIAAEGATPAADRQLESLSKKRATLAGEISAREEAIKKTDSAANSDDSSDVKASDTDSKAVATDETLYRLRSLDAIYVRHQTLLEQRSQIELQAKQAVKDLEALDKFKPDEPKPYSFLLLENLSDQLSVEEDRQEAIETDLKSAEQLLKSAHEELDEVAQERQKAVAKSASKPAGDTKSAKSDAATEADRNEAESRAKIALRQTEIEVQNLRLELCKTVQKQLEQKIAVVKKDMAFTALDRDKQLERLAATEATYKRRRREAENQLQLVMVAEKVDLDKLASENASPTEREDAKTAWRAAAESYQTQIVLLDEQIENSATIRRLWKHRYELASGKVETKTISRWLDDVVDFIEQLDDMSHALEHRREGLRDEQTVRTSAATTVGSAVSAAATVAAETARRVSLEQLREVSETTLAENKSAERMLRRFKSELKTKLKAATGTWGDSAGEIVSSVLGYEVADVGEQSVTVQKILTLLVLIAAGILLAYTLSRLLGRRILPRLGIHHGKVAALKSIAFYTLCVVFGVAAFQLLHIPLAAFAFLGGAAAIAIGFGSQDIMNNFMSGIILLVEQPIRVGDFVQLSSVQGVVLHIGLRSTRLQTDSNHELIVPNKTLLDEEVTNLTLSDNFVQTFVTISVDRDVTVQKAKREMLQIAFLHPMVIKSPRPYVLLKEVDSYWMTFEIHFCMQYQSFIKGAVVQSEILEQISDLFSPKDEDDEDLDNDGKQASGEPSSESAAAAIALSGDAEVPAEGSVAHAAFPAKRTNSAGPITPAAMLNQGAVLDTMKKIGSRAMIKQMKRVTGSVKIPR